MHSFTELLSSLSIIQGNAAVPLLQELDAALVLAHGAAREPGTTSELVLKFKFERDEDGTVHVDHSHAAKSAAKLTDAKGASIFPADEPRAEVARRLAAL